MALGNASVIGACAQASPSEQEEAVMPRLRNGHAPGHVRETFCNAIEAFMAWNDSGPSSMRIVMANSMKIALALLALSVCAGCAPYYDRDYADGRRYYTRTYYDRTKYYDDDRRRRDDDYRDRRLSERYDNRDCQATRDGRVKCYYD
jgi:hypothetical protein